MVAIDVTLTASVNGGPPQQGGITCALDDVIQLSAVSKVGWGTNGPTKWQLVVMDPSFATPAGWTSNGDGSYYVLGSDDPPPFTLNPWDTYAPSVIVNNGQAIDDRTMIRVPSDNGIYAVGHREGSQFGGLVRRWIYTLNAAFRAVAAAAGFNNQASTVNIATAGISGATNAGTRSGEIVTVGPTGEAQLVLTGGTSSIAAEDFEGTLDSLSLAIGGAIVTTADSISCSTTAGPISFTASGGLLELHGETTVSLQGVGTCALHIGDGFGAGDLATSCTLNATTLTIGGNSTTWTEGNSSCARTISASSLALTTTSGATLNVEPIRLLYRVRVIATGNVANLTTVTTMDGVTLADGDLVLLPLQSTPTQNGLYRYTLSTTTLARATAFDSLAEYHLGTTARAYAGTANKGKAYQLTALSSSLPATWEDVSGSGGGGGTGITNGGGSLSLDGSGNALGSFADLSLGATGVGSLSSGGSFTVLAEGGDSVLYLGGTAGWAEMIGATRVHVSAPSVAWTGGSTPGETPGVGGQYGWLWDASGGALRGRFYEPTSGALGLTHTIDAATAAMGYEGTLAFSVASGRSMGFTSPENVTWSVGNNWNCYCSNNATLLGTNLLSLQVGTTKRRITFGTTAVDYVDLYVSADSTIGNGATVTLATLVRTGAKAGGKPIRVRYDVLVWDSAGNVTTREVRFTMRRNGSNGVLVGTPYVSSVADDAVEIASLTIAVSNDASGVITTLANASGGSVDACIVGFEVYR